MRHLEDLVDARPRRPDGVGEEAEVLAAGEREKNFGDSTIAPTRSMTWGSSLAPVAEEPRCRSRGG